jgi:hypothetical protein
MDRKRDVVEYRKLRGFVPMSSGAELVAEVARLARKGLDAEAIVERMNSDSLTWDVDEVEVRQIMALLDEEVR